jgi:hypothetical protein
VCSDRGRAIGRLIVLEDESLGPVRSDPGNAAPASRLSGGDIVHQAREVAQLLVHLDAIDGGQRQLEP